MNTEVRNVGEKGRDEGALNTSGLARFSRAQWSTFRTGMIPDKFG